MYKKLVLKFKCTVIIKIQTGGLGYDAIKWNNLNCGFIFHFFSKYIVVNLELSYISVQNCNDVRIELNTMQFVWLK